MQEPIRIAHVIGKWIGGGVEAVVMNYYRNIDRKKVQFDFICDEDSTCIPYDEIESLGGRVIIVPPYQKVIKYHKALKRIFEENNYKIVHSHINTLSIFPLLAAKRAGVPTRIAHSHSTTSNKEIKRNLIKKILRPFSKIFATNYFCCSELAGRWQFGNKEYDKGNVYLLNNAIDLNQFKYNAKVRNCKRKELNISKNSLVIGNVGRFVNQKNHEFLIEVFNEIQKQHKDTLLLLAGTGPLEEIIKVKAKNLGLQEKVIFLGQREDVNELYQAMDIFILPSLYEGLGLVLIEAQISGLPCICSNNIPLEAKLINNMLFIDLNEPIKEWSDRAIKILNKHSRKDSSKKFDNSKFNITKGSKKLENKYIKLIERKD